MVQALGCPIVLTINFACFELRSVACFSCEPLVHLCYSASAFVIDWNIMSDSIALADFAFKVYNCLGAVAEPNSSVSFVSGVHHQVCPLMQSSPFEFQHFLLLALNGQQRHRTCLCC